MTSESSDEPFDPLTQITKSFPGSVKLNVKRRVLEFCPDETCDGFVALNGVSVGTLKDFAYLYIYFFSDYLVYLPEWRNHPETRAAAERVLSRSEYSDCKSEDSRAAARCVLLKLSKNGEIKLLLIRYDERQRNVVPMDIEKELSVKKPDPKP